MVILATLALSLMIGNHWLAPLLLRGSWSRAMPAATLRGSVLLQRRRHLAVMLLAWATAARSPARSAGRHRRAVVLGAGHAGAGAGLRGVAPADAAARGAVGLLAGFALWSWVLLLPSLFEGGARSPAWLREGPFGLSCSRRTPCSASTVESLSHARWAEPARRQRR
jgi:hypothetical protein